MKDAPRAGELKGAGAFPKPGIESLDGAAQDGWDAPQAPSCESVTLDGEAYTRIRSIDRLPPFLINLPTDTDLWMFISSNGGLTAGRRDPDGALFPYEPVDKLHDGPYHTGPVTIIRWQRKGLPEAVWEPFSLVDAPGSSLQRSLGKNATGNRLIFEEINHEAQLVFRYLWTGSDATGWVRTSRLTNLGRRPVLITLLDGLRNILPSGAPLSLYQQSSCLVDAYKHVDVDPESGLAIFSLTSKISDRPEPAEELRATTVWSHGLAGFQVALSLDALRDFRRGDPVDVERVLTGRRGNYLVTSTMRLNPGDRAEWHIAADTGRSHIEVARLRARLLRPGNLRTWIEDSLRGASENLRRIVGSADGIQLTGRPEVAAHHFTNVLFNSLRGGVFVKNHTFPKSDLIGFLQACNHDVAARHAGLLARLPDEPEVGELQRAAEATGDADLRRICLEYLPLCFGRRHGDPSRPWNRFSIRVRNPDGSQALRYEGNWRDLFQNWEALTRSFPLFIPGVIAKYVNASTVDGFNPYRITREGIDWEVLDPANPWSGIGYWGDHQIAYLLKFLESMPCHFPGVLERLLGQEIFCYADVPYRLKPYAEMLVDPKATIRYDNEHAARVAEREATKGHDGKLVHAPDGKLVHASLLEKLLVPALAKVSSFVPDGGIWMNTQRPEWNDANNALAGNGLSVVTLCHLLRYLRFLMGVLDDAPVPTARISVEVVTWLRQTADVLHRHRTALQSECVDDKTRKRLMDGLGLAFSEYRERVYAGGFSAKAPVDLQDVIAWCRVASEHVGHAIRANRRSDGLYHSYNLLEIRPDGTWAAVRPLGLMLEGQVAALSSGVVRASEAVELLASLLASPLYREDQNSFMLYPNKELPSFLDRNRIPEAAAIAVPLVGELLARCDSSVVERDADGLLRFHADFSSARDLSAALDRLALNELWAPLVARDGQALLDLFVDVFGHRTFTGRSGTMYAYEGLGCVYWHMVSKLLLTVQEVTLRAYEEGEPDSVCEALSQVYYRIRGGLGFEKTVSDYGAFPTDPYSHTPAHAGAQQPGMTGQVKEEILTRFGELGVRVQDGIVGFDPVLLRRDEFLVEPGKYQFFALDGIPRSLDVPPGVLAFSYCQVPVVYILTDGEAWVRVTSTDGVVTEKAGHWLSASDSAALIGRLGRISRIDVGVPERKLYSVRRAASIRVVHPHREQ